MTPRTAPTPATTTITELKPTPCCPACGEPIRDPAGYVQLLAYQLAIVEGSMSAADAMALLLLRDEPPDAAA